MNAPLDDSTQASFDLGYNYARQLCGTSMANYPELDRITLGLLQVIALLFPVVLPTINYYVRYELLLLARALKEKKNFAQQLEHLLGDWFVFLAAIALFFFWFAYGTTIYLLLNA